jgi:coproporphyrinogen III oxidase-like Fe-S oxidoreductase
MERESKERLEKRFAEIDEEHRQSQEDIEAARLAWEEMLKNLLKNTGVNLNEKEAALSKLIIEAGYRAVSKKIHPDVGGTHEDMVALNNAKDKLLTAIH